MITTPLTALMVYVRGAMLLVLLPTLKINLVNVIAGGHWFLQLQIALLDAICPMRAAPCPKPRTPQPAPRTSQPAPRTSQPAPRTPHLA
ncbi:Membrane fusion component of tripartite multidrug resistance system, partial [Olavius sp. associated proteobacterium Delta 1]